MLQLAVRKLVWYCDGALARGIKVHFAPKYNNFQNTISRVLGLNSHGSRYFNGQGMENGWILVNEFNEIGNSKILQKSSNGSK